MAATAAAADCTEGPVRWVGDPAFSRSIDTTLPLSRDAALRIALLRPSDRAADIQRAIADAMATEAALALGRAGIPLSEISDLRAVARDGDLLPLRAALFAAPQTSDILSAQIDYLWTFGCAQDALALISPELLMDEVRAPARHLLIAEDDPAWLIERATVIYDYAFVPNGEFPGWFRAYTPLAILLVHGGADDHARIEAALASAAELQNEQAATSPAMASLPRNPAISLLLEYVRRSGLDVPDEFQPDSVDDFDSAIGAMLSDPRDPLLRHILPDLIVLAVVTDECDYALGLAVSALQVADMDIFVRVVAQAAIVHCRSEIAVR